VVKQLNDRPHHHLVTPHGSKQIRPILTPDLTHGSLSRSELDLQTASRLVQLFWTAHPCAQHTDRQTTLRATSIAIVRIYAMRAIQFFKSTLLYDTQLYLKPADAARQWIFAHTSLFVQKFPGSAVCWRVIKTVVEALDQLLRKRTTVSTSFARLPHNKNKFTISS